jgi:hypothetical protein
LKNALAWFAPKRIIKMNSTSMTAKTTPTPLITFAAVKLPLRVPVRHLDM